MMTKPLILLILVAFLAMPAMALSITAEPLGVESTTYDAVTTLSYDGSTTGLGIQRIGMDCQTNTTVTFTLYYGNGETVTGSVSYGNDGFYQQQSDIALGSITSRYEYVGVEEMGRFYVTGYAINESLTTGLDEPGIVLYGSSWGLSALVSDYVFYPTGTGSDGVIYKIDLTSTKPIDVAVMTNPRGEVASAKSKTLFDLGNEWVTLALEIATTLKDLVVATFFWVRFFFWDNLLMTIALYIVMTAAVSFYGANDVFTGIRRFLKYQRTLFEFVLAMWYRIVEIVATFRGIFRV